MFALGALCREPAVTDAACTEKDEAPEHECEAAETDARPQCRVSRLSAVSAATLFPHTRTAVTVLGLLADRLQREGAREGGARGCVHSD